MKKNMCGWWCIACWLERRRQKKTTRQGYWPKLGVLVTLDCRRPGDHEPHVWHKMGVPYQCDIKMTREKS